jgi:hypothetical protein
MLISTENNPQLSEFILKTFWRIWCLIEKNIPSICEMWKVIDSVEIKKAMGKYLQPINLY